jgi:hypothetical protein
MLQHRAERRSMSLDVSAPHRMISGASAIGAQCRQWMFSQLSHHQQDVWRSSASVVGMPVGSTLSPVK